MIQKATAQPAAKAEAKASMQAYIKQMQGEIKKALPAVMTPERFTRIVRSALSTNPKLGQTTPQSFLAAMMTAAQLGMEPNTPLGQAYLIPFYNSVQCMNGIFSFDLVPVNFVVTIVANLLYALVMTAGLAKIFDSEKIMYS